MKKIAIVFITIILFCANALADETDDKIDALARAFGSYVTLEDFLVRYSFRAADSYDLKIEGDVIGYDLDDIHFCSVGYTIVRFNDARKIVEVMVKISEQTTDDEMAAIFCMIDSLEVNAIEYAILGAREARNKAMDIVKKVIDNQKYKGKGYTFYIDTKDGYFCASLED